MWKKVIKAGVRTMSDQLQDLLSKVYEEGVAKAEAEAAKILASAREEADSIRTKAMHEADIILKDAAKRAEEQKKNTQSDLKLAAQHTVNSLKSKITDLILGSVYNTKIAADFSDTDFTKKLILESLEAWKTSSKDGIITIPEAMKAKLEDHFIASMKAVLDNKLLVEFSPAMKNGFTIAPQDGSYKLSFTDSDFANLFNSFLRPRTQKLLFES